MNPVEGPGQFGPVPRVALGITALLAAGIALATLLPVPAGPGMPGSDKAHHLVGFTILALPVALAQPRAMIWMAPLLAAYGGGIELVQPLVGRGREWADWLADLAGIATGTALGIVLGSLWRRRRFASDD